MSTTIFENAGNLMRIATRPKLAVVTPHQPGLGNHAFRFDGQDGMTRNFFHVSDATLADLYDNDRSASFEVWLKLDAMNQQQLLLESGDGGAGLSLSLGDGDGDGKYNDLRFRVLGDDGQHLTLTADIDRFADPTKEFVHLAAVFNDDSADRFLEIYVNGARFGRLDGVDGPGGSINWDDVDLAGLGRAAGAGLGGNGGAGDLPFAGNLAGQVAALRFFNYALNAKDVRDDYNEALDPAWHGVTATTGNAARPIDRPARFVARRHRARFVTRGA